MKKSTYKAIAEAIVFGKLKDFSVPTKNIDHRKMTVDEIKQHIIEEFGKAKNASEMEAEELPKGWGDAEIANQIEWVKKLNIQEFFDKEDKKKK